MTDATSVSLGGETVKATAAKFAMAGIGFAGTVVFARILGPTGFGGFYLLFSLVKLGDRAVNGWGTAIMKRYSEADTPKRELIGGQLVFTVAWLVLTGVLSVLASQWLVSYTGLPEAPVLFVVLMGAVTLYEPTDRVVQSRGLVGASMWIDTFRSLLTFPLQLAFVLLGLGAAGMAYGLAAATFLSLPALWYFVRTKPTVPTGDTLESLWAYAKYSIPNSFLGQAYDRFDILLLGYLLAPAAAGQYEVALKLTMPATFVMLAAQSMLMARVSRLHSQGESVSTDVSNTLAFTSLVAIPMFFGAAVMPELLVVTAYGAEYGDAAMLLVGLALYQVVSTQSGPLMSTLSGIDRPDINTWISAATLSLNVVLGVALTLTYGAIGVVIATVAAETVQYVLAAAVVKRELPAVVLFPRTLVEQVAAAVLMAVVVFFLLRAVPVDRWYHLLAVVSAGAVVYSTALLTISQKLRVTIEGVVRSSRLEL
ncbi:lipopolysaccharide biosynthesis protein [Natrinema halophilum]|uniref:Oligosaccharide flippase family protein n=1 Tax=Natrinema halophilum TaxID=1699371 RepID=A0A7D5KKA8_9EURY|nr:oligosaccharide flippase family protein [Natrinema halophilum]QLG48858.1 oligosaccharide flippase family protein [Natrinema halophilum]